jgi:hypothetical protein
VKLRSKITTVAGILVLAAALAGLPATGASANTGRFLLNGGNYLAACESGGAVYVVTASPSGCQSDFMEFQLQNNGYYYLMSDNTSYCMTFSTTQPGVIKAEGCVAASNQEFRDTLCSGDGYVLVSAWNGGYLKDPSASGGNATWSASGGCSGLTEWVQVA